MVGFRTSAERFHAWILTFFATYVKAAEKSPELTASEWITEAKRDRIVIRLFKRGIGNSIKLATINLYRSTLLITMQGLHRHAWADFEFPRLLRITNNFLYQLSEAGISTTHSPKSEASVCSVATNRNPRVMNSAYPDHATTSSDSSNTQQEANDISWNSRDSMQDSRATGQKLRADIHETNLTEPRDVIQEPSDVSNDPRNVSQKPRDDSQGPPDANQEPRDVHQEPSEVSKEPSDVTQKPHGVNQEPRDVSQEPSDVTQQPHGVNREPRDVGQGPSSVTQQPHDVSQEPRDVSQEPSDVTQHPHDVSRKPRDIRHGPRDVTKGPRNASQEPRNVNIKPSDVSQESHDVSQGSRDVNQKQPATCQGTSSTTREERGAPSGTTNQLDELKASNTRLESKLSDLYDFMIQVEAKFAKQNVDLWFENRQLRDSAVLKESHDQNQILKNRLKEMESAMSVKNNEIRDLSRKHAIHLENMANTCENCTRMHDDVHRLSNLISKHEFQIETLKRLLAQNQSEDQVRQERIMSLVRDKASVSSELRIAQEKADSYQEKMSVQQENITQHLKKISALQEELTHWKFQPQFAVDVVDFSTPKRRQPRPTSSNEQRPATTSNHQIPPGHRLELSGPGPVNSHDNRALNKNPPARPGNQANMVKDYRYQSNVFSDADVLLIGTSNVQNIMPQKIYRSTNVRVKTLGPRKKTIAGAMEFIKSLPRLPSIIVLHVAGNTLADHTAGQAAHQMEVLRQVCLEKNPQCTVVTSDVFPRLINDQDGYRDEDACWDYADKADAFNALMRQNFPRQHVIAHKYLDPFLESTAKNFEDDMLHLSQIIAGY